MFSKTFGRGRRKIFGFCTRPSGGEGRGGELLSRESSQAQLEGAGVVQVVVSLVRGEIRGPGTIKREEIRANIGRRDVGWKVNSRGTVHVAHSTVAPGAYYSRLGRIDLAQIHKAIVCTDTSTTRYSALFMEISGRRERGVVRQREPSSRTFSRETLEISSGKKFFSPDELSKAFLADFHDLELDLSKLFFFLCT